MTTLFQRAEIDPFGKYRIKPHVLLKLYNSKLVVNFIAWVVFLIALVGLFFLILNPALDSDTWTLVRVLETQAYINNPVGTVLSGAFSILFAFWIQFTFRRYVISYFLKKTLYNIRKQIEILHPVSIKFHIWLIRESLEEKNKFIDDMKHTNKITIVEATSILEGFGLKVPSQVFAKLLCYSATMRPRYFRGVWNTIIYPPEKCFQSGAPASVNLIPSQEWEPYFDELERLSSRRLSKVKFKRRVFLVRQNIYDSILDGSQFFEGNPAWKQLLVLQGLWNIERQVFFPINRFLQIKSNLFGEFSDFVIFNDNPKDAWLVGLVEQEKPDGRVKLIKNNEREIAKYLSIFERMLEDPSRLTLTLSSDKSYVEFCGHGLSSDKKYQIEI